MTKDEQAREIARAAAVLAREMPEAHPEAIADRVLADTAAGGRPWGWGVSDDHMVSLLEQAGFRVWREDADTLTVTGDIEDFLPLARAEAFRDGAALSGEGAAHGQEGDRQDG